MLRLRILCSFDLLTLCNIQQIRMPPKVREAAILQASLALVVELQAERQQAASGGTCRIFVLTEVQGGRGPSSAVLPKTKGLDLLF